MPKAAVAETVEDSPLSFQTQDLVKEISQRCEDVLINLNTWSTHPSCSIHRVPDLLQQHDSKKVYTPQIISLGPLHSTKVHKTKHPRSKQSPDRQAMEKHKWRYLHDILNRNQQNWLEGCLEEVRTLEKSARKCYSEEIDFIDSKTFVEMMVLDGCFIIELFRRALIIEEYEDDPIFKLGWLMKALAIDLVMLENQIPFLILQPLFNLMKVSHPSLVDIAVVFFKRYDVYINSLPSNTTQQLSFPEIQHLLHLVHFLHTNLVQLPVRERERESVQSNDSKTIIIPNASQLQLSGIKFKKGKDDGNFVNIKFQKTVIEIPLLIFNDKTIPLFWNLLAFEECYCHCKKFLATYVFFMDCLINTYKDVEILSQQGIIDNRFGTDKEVYSIFKKIGKAVVADPKDFYLTDVCNDINQYCRKCWPKLRVPLKRNYFSNPWAIVSFLAAFLLLCLTITQTIFTAFPSFAPG